MKNYDAIRLIEDRTLRSGGGVFPESPQWHVGRRQRIEVLTVLTCVRDCWTLCPKCVEPARDGVLQVLDQLRQLAPLREVMSAIRSSAVSAGLNLNLYNANGTMKEAPYKILKALAKPCLKHEGIRIAAGFANTQPVKEYSGEMKREQWIARAPDRVWSRTKKGTEALKAAKVALR